VCKPSNSMFFVVKRRRHKRDGWKISLSLVTLGHKRDTMPAQGSGRLTIRFRENVDQLGFIASQSLDLGTAANCRCTDGDQKLKVFSR
jgi:hypothetical protein